MKRVVLGAVAMGTTGAVLSLLGERKIQEVVEKKTSSTPIPCPLEALCHISSKGKLSIEQEPLSGQVSFVDVGEGCKISYVITGLSPGQHALRVESEPLYKTHRAGEGKNAPSAKDLGNIVANESGRAEGVISDKYVKLTGPHSVVGQFVTVGGDVGTDIIPNYPGGKVGCGEIYADGREEA